MKKRRFDFERLAVALALFILILFGMDYLRRWIMGMFVKQPDLTFSHNGGTSSSAVSSPDSSGTSSPDDTSGADSPAAQLGYDPAAYSTISKPAADLGVGPLVLINNDHSYQTAGAPASYLTGFQNVKNDCFRLRNFDVLVRSDLIEPINNLFKSFATATGQKNVVLYSTHETYTAGIYSDAVTERSAGYSVDLSLLGADGSIARFTGDGTYSWIPTNCATYGFVQRFPADKEDATGVTAQPWHYRYVGAPHAALMTQQKLCLEEYIDYLRDFTVSGTHASVSVGAIYYEIYFVPATDGSTAVPVPKTGNYFVSGNNVDGYIVTMEPALT